jgi:hypothetical protein
VACCVAPGRQPRFERLLEAALDGLEVVTQSWRTSPSRSAKRSSACRCRLLGRGFRSQIRQ